MLRSYLAPGAVYYAVSVSLAAGLSLDAGWRYALFVPAAVTALGWLHAGTRRHARTRAA